MLLCVGVWIFSFSAKNIATRPQNSKPNPQNVHSVPKLLQENKNRNNFHTYICVKILERGSQIHVDCLFAH